MFTEDHFEEELFNGLLRDLDEGGCWKAEDLKSKLPVVGHEVLSRVLEKSRSRWEHLELAAHATSEGECDTQLDEWRREHLRVVEIIHPVPVATTPAPTPKKRKASQRQGKKASASKLTPRTSHSRTSRRSSSRKKRSKRGEDDIAGSRAERSPTPEQQEQEVEQLVLGGRVAAVEGGRAEVDEVVAVDEAAATKLVEIQERIQRSSVEVQAFLERYWDEATGLLSIPLMEPTRNMTVEDAVERLQHESLPDHERAAEVWTEQDAVLYASLKDWWATVACAHATRVLLEDVKKKKRAKTSIQKAWKERIRKSDVDQQRFSYAQARKYAALSEFLQLHPEYLRQVAVCSLKAWTETDGGLCQILSADGGGGDVEGMDLDGDEDLEDDDEDEEDGEDGEDEDVDGEDEDQDMEDTEEAPEGEWTRPDMPEAEDLQVVHAPPDSFRGVCGLVNLVNTCYMNSLLQALLSCSPLRTELLRDAPPVTIEQCQTLWDDVAEVSFPNALQMLAGVMWSGEYARVAPVCMQDAVWKHIPAFQCYKEQDAQELLMRLLLTLHRRQRGVFKGCAQYEYSCDACGGRYARGLEPFFQLTFPPAVESRAYHNRKEPPAECSLEDCLQPLFTPSDLDEFRCPLEGCGESGQITRVYRVVEAPQVMCLNLKRFCEPSAKGRRAKNDAAVRFPLEGLELSGSSYRLRATVLHHGPAMGKGHYSCYALNDEAEAWYHFNDEDVQQVGPEEVMEAEAYMLFYERM